MIHENSELKKVALEIDILLNEISVDDDINIEAAILKLRELFNNLFDVDKLYRRKEYLLFPFLENQGITGPPKVMWGKHD
jgi:DUF438 domain-containing protein